MRSPLPILVLLASCAGLSAQQTRAAGPATSPILRNEIGCPVSFGAELNTRVIMHSASDQLLDQKKHGDTPLLELILERLETPQIVRATVKVHGSSAQGRYLPGSDNASRTQIFALDQKPGAASIARREVEVTDMAVVRWAEITELRYANGSAWHSSSDRECRATLSRFHLVDAPAAAR